MFQRVKKIVKTRLPHNIVRIIRLIHTLIFGFASGGIPSALHQRPIILKFINPHKNELIGDLGSGPGIHSAEMDGKGAKVVACDIQEEPIKVVRETTSADILLCDAQYLPFKTECFDKIICTEVLEHLDNDHLGIIEISRVLKKGCIGVVSVPLKGADPSRFFGRPHGEQYLSQLDQYGHKREGYNSQEIMNKLSDAGFEILEYVYAIYLPTQIALALNEYVIKHIKFALPAFIVTFISLLDRIYRKKPFDIMIKIKKVT